MTADPATRDGRPSPNNRAHQLRGKAWMSDSPEGNEAERAEKAAARERYREMWGHEPAEFG